MSFYKMKNIKNVIHNYPDMYFP